MHQFSPPASDFRTAAVAESQLALQLLREAGGGSGDGHDDPMAAGISCCVQADEDPSEVIRRIKWVTVVGLAVGFTGIAAGGALAGVTKYASATRGPGRHWLLGIGTACSLTGFIFLFGAIHLGRRAVREHIKRRVGKEWFAAAPPPALIEIEDTRTVQKLKAVPDDSGFLAIYPTARCVQIEGVSHRYTVFAEDVASCRCSVSKYEESMTLEYRIGAQVLALTIKPMGLMGKFKRQTIGGSSRVLDNIRACLGVDEPVTAPGAAGPPSQPDRDEG